MEVFKRLIGRTIDWLLDTVITEERKRRISNVFTEEQKDRLRQWTQYGKRRRQKAYVKTIKDNIYSLGFHQQGLKELKNILKTSDDAYFKRLVAWEIALYYANLETESGAEEALPYVKQAKQGETSSQQLRRIAIVEAECLRKLDQKEEARRCIENQLKKEDHPDLYLALANLEEEPEERIPYINKIYKQRGLEPVTFAKGQEPTYDTLQMASTSEAIEDRHKVSVLLPAYNAGEGLRTAVDSILSQTWKNLELIIIDDCSSDDTLAIAESYAKQDDRVLVTQTEQNSGPYVARNIGLSLATGDFVTVNDADDWSHESKLATQAQHLINHPEVIANTSSHARLTEELFFYRRGTPGRYMFPNMSSIMFRREPVLEKLGYWDSVRFAADGEFKRRLLQVFGPKAFVDLDTAPLSLPRQAVASLTTSSAFGYNGFFMGARKEFVESFTHYYSKAESFYYPYPLEKRLYPVPEPMWPQREEKEDGFRTFDYVLATDFRREAEGDFPHLGLLQDWLEEEADRRLGIVQMYSYDLEKSIDLAPSVRDLMAEAGLQMLVYGEKINTEKLLIIDYNGLLEEQIYIPEIQAQEVSFLLVRPVSRDYIEALDRACKEKFQVEATFIPKDKEVRRQLLDQYQGKLPFPLAKNDWV